MGEPAFAPIGAHRLIGDGRSTALLRPDGEIDWWCAPEMDSPPLAWSLLDRSGGAARWLGARMADVCDRPAGPTARTTLHIDGARVACWDGLLWKPDGGTILVRAVRCDDRPLRVRHELRLGGFDGAAAEWNGAMAHIGQAAVTAVGGRSTVSGGVLQTDVEGPARVWRTMAIAVNTDPPADDPGTLIAALAQADRAAADRLAGAKLTRLHPERAADALAVLRACTYRPTGMVIASPTTSLPEAPGADRQFDYRYSWIRDTSLAVSVAALLGQAGVAQRYLAAIIETLDSEQLPFACVLTVRGDPVPAEHEIGGVSGWGGSQPTRVGNAAGGQVQYDALGMLIEAVSVYAQMGGRLVGAVWSLVQRIADVVADEVLRHDGPKPDSGIWEFRDHRPFVSSDIGRWMVLDRAIWLARGRRPLARRGHWKQARHEVRERVLGAIDGKGGLPQAYAQPASCADGSALMAVVFHLLERRDPRSAKLVDATLDRLGAGPFLYRYEPGAEDGLGGLEGAFLPVSWWAVAALATTGRLDEARARTDEMCRLLPRLFAEEADPATGHGLGNVPLVWSHMEAARALYLIDAAARRQQWSIVGLGLWRVARFLQARRAARSAGGSFVDRD